jgi:hypothetical protein
LARRPTPARLSIAVKNPPACRFHLSGEPHVSFLATGRLIAIAASCLLSAAAACAAQKSDTILPNTTKGYLSIGNFDELKAAWNNTQLGQLMNDPVMKPFADDLGQQLQRKWTQTHRKLGIVWEDMEGVPSGEIGTAVIQPGEDEAAFAIVVDITDHKQQADQLLEKINKNMLADGAKRSERQAYDANLIVYDIPKRDDLPARQAAFFLKDDILAAADSLKVLEGMAGRMGREANDSLSTLKAYAETMKQVSEASGALVPHARFFVEPFGYTEALRVANSDGRPNRKGQDMLKILKKQGFTCIQGVGGYVNFMADRYELLHRTFIYAPAVGSGPEKHELAARMLKFPNGKDFDPFAWIPREVATYASFNIDMKNAFEASKTLVNEVIGDEVFEDVLTSIEEDPNGPQISIRKDLVAYLGQRAVMISDYQLPITPKSERLLVAIEISDAKAVATTIAKTMKSDPDARRREYNGYEIWEIVDEEVEVPMVTIENTPAFASNANDEEDEDEEVEEELKSLPNMVVTVAHGQMIVATHLDFLVKVLNPISERETLASSVDYNIVRTELNRLVPDAHCCQTFSRTDEEYRAVYELIRQGRMGEAETMFGKLLNRMLGDGKEGSVRQQKIDGSKLPDFETVRRYFGPGGMSVVSDEAGWSITGFTMSKDIDRPAELGTRPEAAVTR